MTKTKALESLVIASFVRGLSTRDVEAALEEALGEQAAFSKSTVSRVCQVFCGARGVGHWHVHDHGRPQVGPAAGPPGSCSASVASLTLPRRPSESWGRNWSRRSIAGR